MSRENPLEGISTADLLDELDAQTRAIRKALTECDVIRAELERRG